MESAPGAVELVRVAAGPHLLEPFERFTSCRLVNGGSAFLLDEFGKLRAMQRIPGADELVEVARYELALRTGSTAAAVLARRPWAFWELLDSGRAVVFSHPGSSRLMYAQLPGAEGAASSVFAWGRTSSPISALCLHGALLAAGSTDGSVRLWRVEDGCLVGQYDSPVTSPISGLSFATPLVLAAASAHGSVTLLDLTSGRMTPPQRFRACEEALQRRQPSGGAQQGAGLDVLATFVPAGLQRSALAAEAPVPPGAGLLPAPAGLPWRSPPYCWSPHTGSSRQVGSSCLLALGSAGCEGPLEVWAAARAGEEAWVRVAELLPGPAHRSCRLLSCCFTPGGDYLLVAAAAGPSGVISFFDTVTWRHASQLALPRSMLSAAVLPEACRLWPATGAEGSAEATLRLELLTAFLHHPPQAVRLSLPQQRHQASGEPTATAAARLASLQAERQARDPAATSGSPGGSAATSSTASPAASAAASAAAAAGTPQRHHAAPASLSSVPEQAGPEGSNAGAAASDRAKLLMGGSPALQGPFNGSVADAAEAEVELPSQSCFQPVSSPGSSSQEQPDSEEVQQDAALTENSDSEPDEGAASESAEPAGLEVQEEEEEEEEGSAQLLWPEQDAGYLLERQNAADTARVEPGAAAPADDGAPDSSPTGSKAAKLAALKRHVPPPGAAMPLQQAEEAEPAHQPASTLPRPHTLRHPLSKVAAHLSALRKAEAQQQTAPKFSSKYASRPARPAPVQPRVVRHVSPAPARHVTHADASVVATDGGEDHQDEEEEQEEQGAAVHPSMAVPEPHSTLLLQQRMRKLNDELQAGAASHRGTAQPCVPLSKLADVPIGVKLYTNLVPLEQPAAANNKPAAGARSRLNSPAGGAGASSRQQSGSRSAARGKRDSARATPSIDAAGDMLTTAQCGSAGIVDTAILLPSLLPIISMPTADLAMAVLLGQTYL